MQDRPVYMPTSSKALPFASVATGLPGTAAGSPVIYPWGGLSYPVDIFLRKLRLGGSAPPIGSKEIWEPRRGNLWWFTAEACKLWVGAQVEMRFGVLDRGRTTFRPPSFGHYLAAVGVVIVPVTVPEFVS